MKITVKLFSLARELAGFDERVIELNRGSVASDVVGHLAEGNPAFSDWRKSLRIAVNCEYVVDGQLLQDGDEVAIIPPVSGG